MRKLRLMILTLSLILVGSAAVGANDELTWTEDQVRHKLVMLPYYSVFDNIQFQAEGDKVILTGSVIRPTLKNAAADAVKRVEGIREVVNNIEVLPLSQNDDRIRNREYRAIYGNSAMTKYAIQAVPPIHIIVKNGHVTLEGVVRTQADSDLAGNLARGVSDVFSVTNNLVVEKN